MKIGLFTDAPYNNLALMKLSTFHKEKGDRTCIDYVPMWYGEAKDYEITSDIQERLNLRIYGKQNG